MGQEWLATNLVQEMSISMTQPMKRQFNRFSLARTLFLSVGLALAIGTCSFYFSLILPPIYDFGRNGCEYRDRCIHRLPGFCLFAIFSSRMVDNFIHFLCPRSAFSLWMLAVKTGWFEWVWFPMRNICRSIHRLGLWQMGRIWCNCTQIDSTWHRAPKLYEHKHALLDYGESAEFIFRHK